MENSLAYFCLLRRGRSSKLVKFYVKPLVNLVMDSMVLVADLLGRALLLHGFRLRGRPVLVRPAYVERVVPAQPAVAREHVGAQHTSDDVPEVRDVVHVGQGAGDEYVAAAGDRQLRRRRRGRRRHGSGAEVLGFGRVTAHYLVGLVGVHGFRPLILVVASWAHRRARFDSSESSSSNDLARRWSPLPGSRARTGQILIPELGAKEIWYLGTKRF